MHYILPSIKFAYDTSSCLKFGKVASKTQRPESYSTYKVIWKPIETARIVNEKNATLKGQEECRREVADGVDVSAVAHGVGGVAHSVDVSGVVDGVIHDVSGADGVGRVVDDVGGVVCKVALRLKEAPFDSSLFPFTFDAI